MTSDRTTMTFEEFIQSTISVVDRVLEASRASENELMRSSHVAVGSWWQLPQINDTHKGH